MEAVDISSINSRLGGPSETELGDWVEAQLAALGLAAIRQPVPGRSTNVIARLEGNGQQVLAFEAHMDTVAASGQAQTRAVLQEGRIHGRGACDTKGSLVAMLEALRLLQAVPASARCTVVLAATVDEEVGADGVQQLIKDGPRLDLAVVGEPTGLANGIAHKGLLRFTIRALGSPAHASKPHLGVNAIYGIAAVLETLQRDVIPGLSHTEHPLLGIPTLAVTTIRGGVAENVIPAEATIGIDRRLNPGEDAVGALEGLDAALASQWPDGIKVVRDEPWFMLPPLETAADHPLVQAMTEARRRVLGTEDGVVGLPYGSDGSWLSSSGVPTIVFGPGSIDSAHSDDESVEVAEVVRAAEILAELACILGAKEPA